MILGVNEVYEEFSNRPIAVGDTVKITNAGCTYSSYKEWINQFNIETYMSNWREGDQPDSNGEYTVHRVEMHNPSSNRILLLIADWTGYYIIGEEGVELSEAE